MGLIGRTCVHAWTIAGLAVATLSGGAIAETLDGRSVVIVDGDTIALPGEARERIRLLDIDAPESHQPRCEAELVAGLRAKAALARLLRAGPVTIERHGRDRYGRTLARIATGRGDAGAALIAAGLALPYEPGPDAASRRLAHWCGQP